MMALDVGPATVAAFIKRLPAINTIIWNGPLGAFETTPFDASTNELAEAIATATEAGTLGSVGGGGDTVSALKLAGVLAIVVAATAPIGSTYWSDCEALLHCRRASHPPPSCG